VRRALGTALIAALVVALGAPAKADPAWPQQIGWRGCPAPAYDEATYPADPPALGSRVLVIGDSLTRDSREATLRQLRQDGWNPMIRCWGGKRMDWGVAQVKRARKLGQLPQTVVVALGTNDLWRAPTRATRASMGRLLDEIGPYRTVIWVNLHFDGGIAPSRKREQWFNEQLLREARDRPNLIVLDWADTARSQGVRTRDGVHYRTAGSRARARAIAEALRATLPADDATRGVLASG
jgi:hypothetical protein